MYFSYENAVWCPNSNLQVSNCFVCTSLFENHFLLHFKWAGCSNSCRISPWWRHHFSDKGGCVSYRGLITHHWNHMIVHLFLTCLWLSVWCSPLTNMFKQIFCIMLSNLLLSGYILCAWIIWFVGHSNWCSNKSWLVYACSYLFIYPFRVSKLLQVIYLHFGDCIYLGASLLQLSMGVCMCVCLHLLFISGL